MKREALSKNRGGAGAKGPITLHDASLRGHMHAAVQKVNVGETLDDIASALGGVRISDRSARNHFPTAPRISDMLGMADAFPLPRRFQAALDALPLANLAITHVAHRTQLAARRA